MGFGLFQCKNIDISLINGVLQAHQKKLLHIFVGKWGFPWTDKHIKK
jgi:hypothetical protein